MSSRPSPNSLSEPMSATRRRHILLATPWAPMGGGMLRVADYLVQSQDREADERHAELRPLESRGGGGGAWSLVVVLGALAKVLRDWLGGNLAGVHINVAERLSLVRKGLIVALCRLLGVPTVLHLHAAQLPQNFGGMSALSRRLTCRMFALATLVVVLGEGARRFVVETLGVPADRVHVIANGVPGPAALPGARAVSGARALSAADAVAPPGLRLLFVGNLSERKGVTDLLESVAALRRSRPDLALDLQLLGGGDVPAYQAKADALGIADIGRFAGWQDQAGIAAAMASADALVLPSYDEGLPLVILEALANALPVICTPVGEIPQNLVADRDALFITPGDQPALAAAIARLADEPALRQRLGREGRALYEAHFGLDRFFDRIADVHRAAFGVSAKRR